MKFDELKIILRRLYKEYVQKHLKRIILALLLSIIVAGSTSGIAWLLDPAVKKIFIEQDKVFAWSIPLLIVIAFSSKGLSLYLARTNIIKVGEEVAGELQKKVAKNVIIKMSPLHLKNLTKNSTKKSTPAGLIHNNNSGPAFGRLRASRFVVVL